MHFLRLSKIKRPSAMPCTIDAKLSSIRMTLAASLATSLPMMPMATPTSAFLRAGESLTPSPVTATMCCMLWRWATMSCFCWGMVRANTICLRDRAYLEKVTRHASHITFHTSHITHSQSSSV